MHKPLIEYLPSIMQEIKEFQVLSSSEDHEILALWQVLDDIMDDQYVNDATENGVNRWESILKITPKGTDTMDVRKFRILTRLNEKLPYTETTLHHQLKTLCGAEGYTMTVNYGSYTLTVKIAIAAKGSFDEVVNLMKRTAPANMVVDVTVLYNQHSLLANFTHSQLSAYTHDQLRNEVIS